MHIRRSPWYSSSYPLFLFLGSYIGDAGYLRDGELFLTERIKDLYKTSNGKYIAPQMVEAMLLVDKYIDQVAVIADQRKFVSALSLLRATSPASSL